jgi:anti-sigma factor RsiW
MNMNENFCTYTGKRDEILIAYLYGEIAADERAAFDRHLLACAPCRVELDALGDVRSNLSRWAPPEPAGHVAFSIAAPAARQKSIGTTIREIPVWAQVVAATLFLGAAAGLANFDVSYTAEGLSVRTGWRHPASAESLRTSTAPTSTALTSMAPASTAPAAPTTITTSSAPWKNDLAVLERELRTALAAQPAATPSMPISDDVVLRRMRQLIQESERRQQSELALRVAEVARDAQSQRQADLVKIDRTLGLIQNSSRMEVMRTQRQVNSLAQQVSQRP